MNYIDIESHERLKATVEDLQSEVRSFAVGLIVDYNSEKHAAKCQILPQLGDKPDITGWIPILSPLSGSGTGIQAAPVKNKTRCLIIYIGNPVGAMFILGMFYSQINPAPGAKEGEIWIQHKTQSVLAFKDDSGVVIAQKSGSIIYLLADGSIQLRHRDGNFILLDTKLIDIKNQSGAEQTIENDGSITITSGAGAKITIDTAGAISIKTAIGSEISMDLLGGITMTNATKTGSIVIDLIGGINLTSITSIGLAAPSIFANGNSIG